MTGMRIHEYVNIGTDSPFTVGDGVGTRWARADLNGLVPFIQPQCRTDCVPGNPGPIKLHTLAVGYLP